ncbi:hypothetical protein Tco_1430226 [Tanacetum coccineum]
MSNLSVTILGGFAHPSIFTLQPGSLTGSRLSLGLNSCFRENPYGEFPSMMSSHSGYVAEIPITVNLLGNSLDTVTICSRFITHVCPNSVAITRKIKCLDITKGRSVDETKKLGPSDPERVV